LVTGYATFDGRRRIALDGRGNLAMPFNTEGMYRGYVTTSGEVVTKIFAGE
jgi:isoaspartyl peptidase/L-asparaginase-like protein (Ntn-hydrolase superfamily)